MLLDPSVGIHEMGGISEFEPEVIPELRERGC